MSTKVTYALTTTVRQPYERTLAATRAALAEQGFGILTEIDIRATMKAKLDVDVAPQVILGACRPPLAHAALQVEPSVGLLLPCNVVVRAVDGQHHRRGGDGPRGHGQPDRQRGAGSCGHRGRTAARRRAVRPDAHPCAPVTARSTLTTIATTKGPPWSS